MASAHCAPPETQPECRASGLQHRYYSWKLSGPYDVIVVGADLASLSSAACLARLGQKVLVLEADKILQAAAPVFQGNGYRWYNRVEYFGAAGQPEALAHHLSAFISEGRIAWHSLQENNDTVVINGESFGLISGHKNFAQSVIRHFPREEKAVNHYIELVHQACALAEQQDFAAITPWPQNLLLKYRGQHPLLQRTTREVLSELTGNEKLIALLTANWADLGIPPAESLFVQHALHVRQKLMASFYPQGGSEAVIEDIIATIEGAGGNVFHSAVVDRILLKGDHAIGVEMQDGQCIYAAKIIHAPVSAQRQHKVKTIPAANATGHMSLYIGLNRSAAFLNLPRTDYWIYSHMDYEQAMAAFCHNVCEEFPAVHIAFAPLLNCACQCSPKDCATIEIQVPVPLKWFSRWQNAQAANADDDYAAFTASLCKRLIETLLKRFPHLARHIDYYELVTPATRQRLPDGPVGRAENPPAIKNLHLPDAGLLPGMPGSLYAGIICASQVAGFTYRKMARRIFPLQKKILKKDQAMLAG